MKQSAQLSPSEKQDIFLIWNRIYPSQIAYKTVDDFEAYLSTCGNASHFLALEDQRVIGWHCVFERNGERWFALLVDQAYQRQGIGRSLILQMQQSEREVNGWIVPHNDYLKVDGTPYLSPENFYRKLGFEFTDIKFETDLLSTVKIKWTKKN